LTENARKANDEQIKLRRGWKSARKDNDGRKYRVYNAGQDNGGQSGFLVFCSVIIK